MTFRSIDDMNAYLKNRYEKAVKVYNVFEAPIKNAIGREDLYHFWCTFDNFDSAKEYVESMTGFYEEAVEIENSQFRTWEYGLTTIGTKKFRTYFTIKECEVLSKNPERIVLG